MKKFDFSKSKPNPYVDRVKTTVTISLDTDIVDYFKQEEARTGIPYQTLINVYLGECADRKRRITYF